MFIHVLRSMEVLYRDVCDDLVVICVYVLCVCELEVFSYC